MVLSLVPRAFVDSDAGVSRDVIQGDEHVVTDGELRHGHGLAVVGGANETNGFGVLEEHGKASAGGFRSSFDEDEGTAFDFHSSDVGDARATMRVAA